MNKFLKIIKKRLDNYKKSNNNCQKLNEVIFELDELVNIAETQISQSNNGWISVDDKLPKTFTNVLVFSELNINDEPFDCIGIGYIDDDKFWQYDESFGYHHCDPYFIRKISSNDLTDVQYWQPLPEPPKE